jgi:hypothetical protein
VAPHRDVLEFRNRFENLDRFGFLFFFDVAVFVADWDEVRAGGQARAREIPL